MLYHRSKLSPTPRGRWKGPRPARGVVSRCSIAKMTCAIHGRRGHKRPRRGRFEQVVLPTTSNTRVDGIDLRISPNQIVALVGGTGAARAPCQSRSAIYDPSAGVVSLDARDVARSQKSRCAPDRHRSQPRSFFHHHPGNIAYGRPGRPMPRFAKRRGAPRRRFHFALPNGYDSAVGERGGHLSVASGTLGLALAFHKTPHPALDDDLALDRRRRRSGTTRN